METIDMDKIMEKTEIVDMDKALEALSHGHYLGEKNQSKRLLNVKEMLVYTGLGRTSGLAWCKKIGALKHIGKRALYDKAIIDKAIDGLTE